MDVGTTPRHCPHCYEPLTGADPRAAVRCGACRLVVGADRGLEAVDGHKPGGAGTAANVLRTRLARETGTKRTTDEVVGSLRRAAALAGIAISDLRMIDYAELERPDAGLVPLIDLLATFGGWKPARAAAMQASRREREALLEA